MHICMRLRARQGGGRRRGLLLGWAVRIGMCITKCWLQRLQRPRRLRSLQLGSHRHIVEADVAAPSIARIKSPTTTPQRRISRSRESRVGWIVMKSVLLFLEMGICVEIGEIGSWLVWMW